jgi:ATP-binding cassette subfamily F protein 3
LLTASGLTKAYGDRVLFSDVSIQLSKGRRVALVGANGTGKTTLIEILLGLDDPDSGEVHRPKEWTLGYLPQDPTGDPEGTVLEAVLSGAGRLATLAEQLRELEGKLSDSGPDHDDVVGRYGEVQARFEQLGGYSLEAEAHRVLAGLGFSPADSARPVGELSGGWRMRVALARLLLAAPDVLILDEPTNHLDVDSVAWLERHLAEWPGALLFVSHDRDFIDAVAERIVELSGGMLDQYIGGFAEFVVEREERLARIEGAAARQQREVVRVERFVERFRYKASKARQVQSRIKTLEKLDLIEIPDQKQLAARFAFPEPPRSSRVVVEMEGVAVGYDGQTVLSGVDLVLERGRKVALVGPNGAGKSTLVKLLLGQIQASEGTVTVGANVEPAVFEQQQAEILDPSKTVVEEFRAGLGKILDGKNVRTLLGSFGFPGDAGDRRVAELSGGECTRLALGKAMVAPANLLVFDEPTNHLDLPSCDLLEDALRAYPGTIVLVTHDRYLIREVADSLVVVRGGSAVWHDGMDESLLTPPAPDSSPPTKRRSQTSDRSTDKRAAAENRNASYQLTKTAKRKLVKVERQWEKAEGEVADLQRTLAEPSTYDNPERVVGLTRELDAAKGRASDLMAEWETATLDVEKLGAG